MRPRCWLYSTILLATCSPLVAQSGPIPSDATDPMTFRTLFNRDLLLNDLADEADTAGTAKPYLRKQLANRFSLSDTDCATLHRLAVQYKSESDPLRARVNVVLQSLNSRFPNSVIPPGADTSPPPELHQLQLQEDALTLRYRDLLHNAMREADFQLLQTKARATFGGVSSK